MNISEANDLNTVLRYLLGISNPFASKDPDYPRLAALRLSDRAYKALSAGLRPEEIDRAWPKPKKGRKS